MICYDGSHRSLTLIYFESYTNTITNSGLTSTNYKPPSPTSTPTSTLRFEVTSNLILTQILKLILTGVLVSNNPTQTLTNGFEQNTATDLSALTGCTSTGRPGDSSSRPSSTRLSFCSCEPSDGAAAARLTGSVVMVVTVRDTGDQLCIISKVMVT